MPPTHPLGLQDAPDLNTVGLGDLDQTVEGPLGWPLLVVGGQIPASRALRPARWLRTGQRDDLAPFEFADTAYTSRPGQVTQPVEALVVEPRQPFTHRLHVTAQRRWYWSARRPSSPRSSSPA
jgi:hypothetical protein